MEFHIKAAESITDMLENRFKIFNFKFGLDPLLGLIPWLGDFIGLLLSLYLIWIGSQLRLPEAKMRTMVRNVLFDFVIGIIPFFGSVGDFFFKANSKNLRIIKQHFLLVNEAIIIP